MSYLNIERFKLSDNIFPEEIRKITITQDYMYSDKLIKNEQIYTSTDRLDTIGLYNLDNLKKSGRYELFLHEREHIQEYKHIRRLTGCLVYCHAIRRTSSKSISHHIILHGPKVVIERGSSKSVEYIYTTTTESKDVFCKLTGISVCRIIENL